MRLEDKLCAEVLRYKPLNSKGLNSNDVYNALDFLVFIDSKLVLENHKECKSADCFCKIQSNLALSTIRLFAQQILPIRLAEMRRIYYSFISDNRYKHPCKRRQLLLSQ